jgi:DNA-binding MarR family transcriptional regulator
VGRLAVTVMELTDRMSRARTQLIDRTALGVLRIAATGKGIRPTGIAEELRVHPSSVTRHVQVLAGAGKLAIRPDPADGRASLVEITKAGLDDLWQTYEQGVSAFQEALTGWSPDDVCALSAGLSRLMAALDTRAEHHPTAERPDRQ